MSSGPDSAMKLTVRLLLEEGFDGRTLALPIADLDKSSLGTPAQVLEEQQAYLEAYLATTDASTLARFSMPKDVELFDVEVVIERDDLPRALQIVDPLHFDTVLLGQPNGDAWVIVPRLRHTFHVSKKEDRREAIRDEIQRVATALLVELDTYRRFFPAKTSRIETLEVPVDREDRLPTGRAASLKKRLIERNKKRDAKKVLDSVGIAIHERPEAHAGPPIVGRDRLVDSLTPLLTGKARINLLLFGDELVGKSAVLYAWLRSRGEEKPMVYQTSAAQLVAGMSGLGQWQERVRRVLEAAEQLDAVLYIDDLRDLFHDRATGSIDLPNAMKPYLEAGRVRMLGEITPAAFSTLEDRAVGFFSCFTRLRVDALDDGSTRRALVARVDHDRTVSPDRPTLTDDAIDTVLDLTKRYLVYQPNPGKVMRLYGELRAIYERDVDERGRPHPIDGPRVLDAFSRQTGIPGFLLREDRALDKLEVVEQFERNIIGQKEAVARVVDTICVVKAGLQPSGKPLATFLFIGPTGVGKTELARTLAKFLFQAPDRMVRFDMSEYADPLAAERLIRGTDRKEGLLTQKIRQQPFSVLLLDEIEKAHPAVLDLMLQVCGEGRLTDARGKTAYFHNAIIIMTSNLGASHRPKAIGLDAPTLTDEAHYRREVQRNFRPELVNRLDRIIAFDPLTQEEILAVARVALAKITKRRGFTELSISMSVTDAALARLAEDGYSPIYGARAIRRVLEDELVAPIARLLARAGADARRARVVASLESEPSEKKKAKPLMTTQRGPLTLRLFSGRAAVDNRDLSGTERVAQLRRIANRHMNLDSVVEAVEQLSNLRSQLSQVDAKDADQRTTQERAELMRAEHRYAEAVEHVQRCMDDLIVAEELAVGALYTGGDVDGAVEEAEAAYEALAARMVFLLLVGQEHRDAITLRLTELDDGRAAELWLLHALDDFDRRGWEVTCHFWGEPKKNSDPWEGLSPWGPPRNADQTRARLAQPSKPRTILVRVAGTYAGGLLAAEAGRHLFEKPRRETDKTELGVELVSMRYAMKEELFTKESMFPAKATYTLRTSLPVIRTHDGVHDRLTVFRTDKSFAVATDAYWRHLERIAFAHLLVYENDIDLDRDTLFVGPLDREVGFAS